MSRDKTVTAEYDPVNDARMGTLQDLLEAAHALNNLGVLSIQRRIHDACNKREITTVELHDLQTGFNGVRDHLTEVIDILSRLRFSNQCPDPDGDRDYAGPPMPTERYARRSKRVPFVAKSEGPDGEQFNAMQD